MLPQHVAQFSILHISDPHWIHPDAEELLAVENALVMCDANRDDNQKKAAQAYYKIQKGKLEDAKRHYKDIVAAFKKQRLDSFFKKGISILVHTGDSANFYDYHNYVGMNTQFESISAKLLPLLLNKYQFDRKFAVPGNHDTKRADDCASNEMPFDDFKKAFSDWETPFSDKVPPVEHNGVKIAFLPINSCEHCGIEKTPEGKVYDEIIIDIEKIREWSTTENAALSMMNIALVHHNPLPNHGETERLSTTPLVLDIG